MRRIRQSFDEQLQSLERHLLAMGERAEAMLAKLVEALALHNVELAHEVIAEDDRVDEMDLGIEHECMRLLALQQPMSRDLRTIGTVMSGLSVTTPWTPQSSSRSTSAGASTVHTNTASPAA